MFTMKRGWKFEEPKITGFSDKFRAIKGSVVCLVIYKDVQAFGIVCLLVLGIDSKKRVDGVIV